MAVVLVLQEELLQIPQLPRKSVFFENLHFVLSSYQSHCLKKTETILLYIFITPRPGRRRDAAVERKQFHALRAI